MVVHLLFAAEVKPSQGPVVTLPGFGSPIMTAGSITVHPTPIHRLKLVASFALLGAVVAGAAEILPAVAAAAAIVDLHVIGAVVGGIAGAVQALRS